MISLKVNGGEWRSAQLTGKAQDGSEVQIAINVGDVVEDTNGDSSDLSTDGFDGHGGSGTWLDITFDNPNMVQGEHAAHVGVMFTNTLVAGPPQPDHTQTQQIPLEPRGDGRFSAPMASIPLGWLNHGGHESYPQQLQVVITPADPERQPDPSAKVIDPMTGEETFNLNLGWAVKHEWLG
jgi:hypothetical protein